MRTITITITEDGDQLFLNSPGAAVFYEVGETVKRRASHVVPHTFLLRIIFRLIRACVSDTSKLAAWTRTWRCWWRIDTGPVGGPVLVGRWGNRQQAIEAEISFLNKFFLERK